MRPDYPLVEFTIAHPHATYISPTRWPVLPLVLGRFEFLTPQAVYDALADGTILPAAWIPCHTPYERPAVEIVQARYIVSAALYDTPG